MRDSLPAISVAWLLTVRKTLNAIYSTLHLHRNPCLASSIGLEIV
ncbi:hypothetical protein [Microcoleus sp. B4-D4]